VIWNGLVDITLAVHPEPHLGVIFSRVRFEMNIRSAAYVGVNNDLVDKLDNGAVLLANCSLRLLDLLGFVMELGDDIINSSQLFFAPGKKIDDIKNIASEGHIKTDLFALE